MSEADENIDLSDPKAWYRDGLRFECQQCGDCCRIRGIVWVNSSEIARMARYLGLGYAEFRKTYIRELFGRLSLEETEKGECLLFELKTGRCKIYPVRPNQCSSYPFWPKILASSQSWERQRSRCPGIDAGRLWTYGEIKDRFRMKSARTGPIP